MNKKFYFALALTAGLFASCSSDDLSADAPGNAIDPIGVDEGARISINVGTPNGATRGTGSVQGTSWGGQTFNLFMFDKGSFIPSQYVPSVGQPATDIYNDTKMTTQAGTTIAEQVLDGDVIKYQYFPSTGRFDFWAYRIDDAWVDGTGKAGWEEGADPATKVVEGVAAWEVAATTYSWDNYDGDAEATLSGVEDPTATTEGTVGAIYQNTVSNAKFECIKVNDGEGGYVEGEATQVTVPFIIDGSQDLMVAETHTDAAAEALAAVSGVVAEDAPGYIYSAYAARRGVNPSMTFKHQLARLQFQVKAATRDVSEAATPKIAPGTTNAAGAEYYAGFKVNKVEVWSKNRGKLIVAYKGAAPEERIIWDEGQEWQERTENDAWIETTSLTPFELKSRESEIEKADILFIEAAEELTEAPDGMLSSIPEGYSLLSTTFDNTTVCYTSITKNPITGEPADGTETTFGSVRDNGVDGESVYVIAVRDGDHNDDAHTSWATAIDKADVTAQLGELVPVIPMWEGYSNDGGWKALDGKDTYTWDLILTPTDEQKDAAVDADAVPGTNTAGAEGDIKHVVVSFSDRYYILSEVTRFSDTATEASVGFDPAESAGSAGDICYTVSASGNRTYYEYTTEGVIIEGNAVPTPIGESLMVAPADENGYLVRFSYTRCKMVSAEDFVDMPGEAIINVKTKAGSSFSASKFYTVTAVLYSDGEVKFEEGDIEEQTDGSGDLDDNGEGYGAES